MISNETVEQLLETGIGHFNLPEQRTAALAKEANRLSARTLGRPVTGWEQVRRTTFFNDAHNDKTLNTLFGAFRWVPLAFALSEDLTEELQNKAARYRTRELATYFNRVGLNYFRGRKESPASIPRHLDPRELKGVVALVELSGSAHSSLTDSPGQVALLACKNLCEARKIEQVPHEVFTEQPRTSLTLAQLGNF